jgi:heat shock protein HspQ
VGADRDRTSRAAPVLSVSTKPVNQPRTSPAAFASIDLSGATWPITFEVPEELGMMENTRDAKFGIGQVVRHRIFPFRGVIFDVDPVFNNTEEWWLAIPEEIRPTKDQPYYHLFAENEESEYIAYVSEQNLVADVSGKPLRHPQIKEFFATREGEVYVARDLGMN